MKAARCSTSPSLILLFALLAPLASGLEAPPATNTVSHLKVEIEKMGALLEKDSLPSSEKFFETYFFE